ncbi:MAG TPA: TolC family protein [Bryobacteraceae bacterium]|nr:TolC family protein [Bryobacteraceae bacterium]
MRHIHLRPRTRRLYASLGLGLLFAAAMSGQQSSQFQGSVPAGSASATPLALKLDDAIRRGLQTNLGLLTRDTSSQTARAERTRALAALLPQVAGSLGETEQQLNLKTIGFNVTFPPIPGFHGIPTIVGPFHYTAAQANVSAKVFDWNARKNLSSARASEEAARLSVEDARDLVVQAVASAYLQIIADASRVASVQAQVNTAEAIYNRAVDQKKAGTSPGIDVLRAQVELKTQQQRLLAQQNQFEKDKLALGRVIGLAAGQTFDIADTVPFAPLGGLTQDEALRTALAQRPDYQGAMKLVQGAQESLKAARAEWYPTVNLDGYYGDAGPSLNNSHGVFLLTGALNFNIFNGGRIRGDMEQAKAALKQRSDELADLGGQIDYQVRAAFLDIRTAADQVAVAQSNLELASQTLEQSRDRFAAGVADTVEVVQAQESVAAANDSTIAARFAHNLAKVELARALGLAEQGIKKFIEVK